MTKAVRIAPTILEVQGYTTGANLKRITDLVEQQGEKLASCEWTDLCKEVFFALQRMSMKWKVQEVEVIVGSRPNRPLIKLDHLAGSSLLDKGHIGILYVDWYREPVSLNALKRVWEISDEMYINEKVKLKGGRGEDREAAWQHVTDYLLRINGNTID